jgi:glycosyltransferase involved in cell wall biosynthesis
MTGTAQDFREGKAPAEPMARPRQDGSAGASPSPAISVLMPVYNGARYLAEAVESILAQTYRDFEFVIVDDGSTDRSPTMLDEYARRDARIKVVRRANTGIVGALNNAIAESKAALIARMDADDVSLPDRLEKQVAYMRDHPECVALGSRVTGIDPYGCVLFQSEHKLAHDEIDAELLNGVGWAIVHPAAMLRRDAVEEVGRYRPEWQWVEDLDLFLRLAEIGKLANLPDQLLRYRQHTESINRTRAAEQARLADACVREAYRRRGREAPAGWRFVPKLKPSKPQQLQTWAWRAMKSGNVPVARKHAVALWKAAPLSVESWRTLLCAMRGH